MKAYTDAERWCDRSGFNDLRKLTSDKGYNLRDRLSKLTTVERMADHDEEIFWFPDESAVVIGVRRVGDQVWKWGIEA